MPVHVCSRRSGGGAARKPTRLRHVVKGGLASALAIVGLVAFATPAFAHNDIVSAQASCANPLGSGYTIVWTIANDYNVTETGSVTSVTGGLATLSSTTYNIAASPGQPYSSTTLTQTLPATASGVITIDISSRWSDGFSTTDTGSYDLSQLNCGAPVTQTIAGHIYLCQNGNPTTTEESGGTLAASGPTTVSATPNPLAPTQVGAGGYTMTATAPPGYTLVVCGGTSTPNGSGSSATEGVTVPSGGAGVGIFYVVQSVTQTIAGHIYLCQNGNPTTTEESGGTLAASGPTTVSATPNPLAPTQVGAGGYTMTATAPPGYTLVVCGGTSTPNGSGSSATEGVTVPSGGAGVGIFYVVQSVTQTIAGHIYLCQNGNPTTTEESGGTLAASGPTTVSATPNPLAPTQVGAGGYTMTATAPPGYTLVVCGGTSTPNGSGSSATEGVTVPSGGAGVGIFYVVQSVTQTIAGHIYLCQNGNPTTTEESGGTLAASGPTTVSATPNPLAPTQVGAGGYTMTATAPPGYTLVVCGGTSTPNGSGSSATEGVTVPSGGAGVGIFYVVAVVTGTTTTTSTGVSSGSGSSGNSSPAPTTSASAESTTTSPVTTSALAFTGAPLSYEWLFGLLMLVLGSAVVIIGRWRRGTGGGRRLEVAQSPRWHAGPSRAALGYRREQGTSGSTSARTTRSGRRRPRSL